jgi:hypothetical protein
MKYRFVDHLIQQLRFDKDIESVKEALFCFENFNLVDSFKKFDVKGRGYISKKCFENQELGLELDVDALIEELDIDGDGKLSYTEWTRALTPKSLVYSAQNGKRATNLPPEEMEARELCWQSELNNLLSIYSKSARFNHELKAACQVDANEIFNEIDEFQMGYISSNML